MGLRQFLHSSVQAFLPYWLFSMGIFWVFAIFGSAFRVGRTSSTTLPVVTDQGIGAIDMPSVGYFFFHNLGVTIQALVGGILGTIPTVYILAFNGLTLGRVFMMSASEGGLLLTIALLLPHGIFELPAIWLTGGIVFRWGHRVWLIATGEKANNPVAVLFIESIIAIFAVVVLLAIAAVIESLVTLPLARALFGS